LQYVLTLFIAQKESANKIKEARAKNPEANAAGLSAIRRVTRSPSAQNSVETPKKKLAPKSPVSSASGQQVKKSLFQNVLKSNLQRALMQEQQQLQEQEQAQIEEAVEDEPGKDASKSNSSSTSSSLRAVASPLVSAKSSPMEKHALAKPMESPVKARMSPVRSMFPIFESSH
jgi:hypothetical protein